MTHRMANRVGHALVERMQAEGHTVGIHTGGTSDHELHTKAEAAGRLEGELRAGKAAIKKDTGTEPTLVRPPTGAFNKAVEATYAKVGLTNLLWDIDGDQGKNLPLGDLQQRIESGVATVHARLEDHDAFVDDRRPPARHPAGTSANLGAIIDDIKATVTKVSGGKDSATFTAP